MIEFDVVVPAFNEGSNLEKVLTILVRCKQFWFNYMGKVIVAVEGEDGSVEIAERFSRLFPFISVVSSVSRRSKTLAVNDAMSQCGSPVVCIIDADTCFSPASFFSLSAFDQEDVGAVGIRTVPVFDSRLVNMASQVKWMLHDICNRVGAARDSYVHTTNFIAVRRKLVPAFPTVINDDTWLGSYVSKLGFKVVYDPSCSVFMKPPMSVGDFISQSERWYLGHRQNRCFGVDPPNTVSLSSILPLYFRFVAAALLLPFLELTARVKARFLKVPNGCEKELVKVWSPIETTKTLTSII